MKEVLKQKGKDFILAILAGISISIGGVANLCSGNKIAGALFFCLGLFMVLTLGFNLFTGKVCYIFEKKINLLTIWLGNFAGAFLTGLVLRQTRLSAALANAEVVAATKGNDKLLSLFVLAIFCNILIYVAVEGFNKGKDPIEKYLSLIFGVSVFVLCGFEHCVADMFYFSYAWAWNWHNLLALLIITLGNCVGALLIPSLRLLLKRLEPKKESTI